MLSKSKLNLLMAFSLMTLVSVGFSSWNISFTNEMTVNGSFDVDEVYTNETFVNVDSIDSFRYYNTGFLTSDNYSSSTWTHTTYATIPTLSDSDISFTVYYDFEIDSNEFKESTFDFLQSNAFSLIVMV